jgi:hypothetical protein
VLYSCMTQTDPAPTKTTCAAGTVCGWDDVNCIYSCVSPPGHADPSNTFPMACQ